MSSTVCRCYGGTTCPAASSGAEEFFSDFQPAELSTAVTDAVSDYVRLRELGCLCPDVRKWGSPPGPAAFLDAGLPKLGGPASLPSGLADISRATSRGKHCSESRHYSAGGAARKTSFSSIPPPTWEKEEDGFVSQVLSFDDTDMRADWDEAPAASGGCFRGSSGTDENFKADTECPGLAESQSTPELGGRRAGASTAEEMTAAASPMVDAKQLLRSLRKQRKTSRQRRSCGRGARRSRPGDSLWANGNIGAHLFSPPDAWDDTGMFTVAPRPKTVPTEKTLRPQHHALATPANAAPSSPPLLPPSLGASAASTRHPLWKKMRDLEKDYSGDGFGLWPKRRRKVGGGGGDAAVEFLDVREAALVCVVEALARRALPWQAQLCPRALQDLEIARVRVFYASERNRRSECEGLQEDLLRGLLLVEERSWDLFAKAQGNLFGATVDKINSFVKERENSDGGNLSMRVHMSDARVQREEALGRYEVNRFEEDDAERAWLYRRSTLVDAIWNPSSSIAHKQVEESKASAARLRWAEGQSRAAVRLDASTWLEAAGASAVASQELTWWERKTVEVAAGDGARAAADRSEERRRSTESYTSVLQTILEADRREREASAESWNLQGWLSVGSHKLVQQTLRALVRRCTHPYAVRNVLWEARQAAEFAAAAREAAVFQRAADAKNLCNTRRDRQITVRKHKRNFLEAENNRAKAEDAERARATEQVVGGLERSALVRREDEEAHFQGERARVQAVRTVEAERSAMYHDDRMALERELDTEAERLASALRERLAEEEQHIKAEEALIAASLKEEHARAGDREALLAETVLRERENEDRLFQEWLLRQEREESNAVADEISKTRTRLTAERERWVRDASAAMSDIAEIDASSLRHPGAWNPTTVSPSISPSDHMAATTTSKNIDLAWGAVQARGEAPRLGQSAAMLADKDTSPQAAQRATASAELEARAAHTRSARIKNLAALSRQGLASHWTEFWCDQMERARMAAAAGDMAAARWKQRQSEAADAIWSTWRSKVWYSAAQRAAMAEEDEEDVKGSANFAAMERESRHEEAGGPDQPEQERASVASKQLGVTEGEAGHGLGTGLDVGSGGADERLSDGGIPEKHVSASVKSGPVESVDGNAALAGLSTVDHGVLDSTNEEHRRPGVTNEDLEGIQAADINQHIDTAEDENSRGGGDAIPAIPASPRNDGTLAVSVGEVEDCNSCLTVAVSEHDGTADGPSMSETTTLANKLVVFVGSATALHLSTIRRCYTENAHGDDCLPRDSVKSSRDSRGETLTCDASEENESRDNVLDQEAQWLDVLENVVGTKDNLDLAELGRAFRLIPGGAAVLCLTHDCLVDEGKGTEGSVQTKILLPAAAAVVALRRATRAAVGATPAGHTAGVLGISGETLASIAEMETAAEVEVFGDELCADLAGIFVDSNENSDVRGVNHTWRVMCALRKHEALLSPQTVGALTALLSAQGQPLKQNCHGVSSPMVDTVAWKPLVLDALLAVRKASLEHAVMWAQACDPERVESACTAQVLATGVTSSETPRNVDEIDDSIAATLAAMQKVSGLGMSAMLVLAITLRECGDSSTITGDTSSSICISCSSSSNIGTTSASRGSHMEDSISHAVRLVLRLLSPVALENVSRRISPNLSETPPANEQTGSDYFFEDRKLGTVSHIPGHPAIGDLSDLDAGTLRKGVAGVLAALDVKNTGTLPLAALSVVLQGGLAGLTLEPMQAHTVLHLAGCSDSNHQRPATNRNAGTAGAWSGGEYCYLGYSPGVCAVRYGLLVGKIHALLTLLQAAHRLRQAGTAAANRPRDMSCVRLERARMLRRSREVDRSAAAFAAALDAVSQRMAYARLERRSSLLEAPRFEAMMRLSTCERESSIATEEALATDSSRREKLRSMFTSAITEWSTTAGATSIPMAAALRARAEATAELWAAGGRAMKKARETLTSTAGRLGANVAEAEERALEGERVRIADEDKARILRDEEPDWWGKGLTQSIDASYGEEVRWGQETVERLVEATSALARDMADTWEDDARKCKDDLIGLEKTLDGIAAEFEERQATAREAVRAAKREPRLSFSGQAGFADLMQSRQRGVNLSRELLTWLRGAANDLELECVELCQSSTELPARMEKRLSLILKASAARVADERSVVARRLLSVSNSWREEILKRKRRWKELREARKQSNERTRSELEVAREKSGPVSSVAALSRATVLADGRKNAEAAVRDFLDHAAGGPMVVEAETAASAAAEDLVTAYEAVKSSIAAAGVSSEDRDTGAVGLLEMLREDTAIRAAASQKAIRAWWELQREALEQGLREREKEAEERRIRREVRQLMSSSLVAEIQAQHDADMLSKSAFEGILAKSKRVLNQFVAAESSATNQALYMAVEARAAVTRESEVLSLEANALSGRVSATLQRALDSATEGLAVAQRKDSIPGKRPSVGESEAIA